MIILTELEEKDTKSPSLSLEELREMSYTFITTKTQIDLPHVLFGDLYASLHNSFLSETV